MLLYIHIPFCDSKCHYCAFNSYSSLHHLKNNYINALCEQLKFELSNNNFIIETIFIGGGTPSTLDIESYSKIFKILRPYLSTVQEITIEANPNSATLHWLKDMYSLGINRISFGVQSFNNNKLRFLGRNHTSKMAYQAINNAYQVGFKDINCDIIYDTVLDTKELINNDLEIIKDLPLNHISAYSLTIENGTTFYNKSNIKVDDEYMAKYIFEQLNRFGFIQYEVSNFTKNNNFSKHNLGYWQYKEYLGIGAGAVGCINHHRLYTSKEITKYIQQPTVYIDKEKLSNDNIKMEKVLLGFRSIVGIQKDILTVKEINKASTLVKENKITFMDNKYNAKDYLLADELALYILD